MTRLRIVIIRNDDKVRGHYSYLMVLESLYSIEIFSLIYYGI